MLGKFLLLAPIMFFMTSCGSLESEESTSKSGQGPAYLALGDSIVFGYTPKVELNRDNAQQGLFVGYPEIIAQKANYQLANASCVGETTGSFLDPTQKNTGCYSADIPWKNFRKIDYDISQNDFARDFLTQNPDTQLVTLTIGGNDLLLVQSECDAEWIPVACKLARIPNAVIKIGHNLIKIIDTIQATGYQGPIVFVTQYATNYKDPIQQLALGIVQAEVRTISHFKHTTVVSGYDVLKKVAAEFDGDSCKAGLIVALEDGTCNIHPSEKGSELLAQAVIDAIRK